MASFKVVSADVASNGSSGFLDVVILCQIGFFILEAATYIHVEGLRPIRPASNPSAGEQAPRSQFDLSVHSSIGVKPLF